MTFALTVLGSSSATPIYDRHPTSQLLNVREKLFLIDCGEGTQSQLMRYRIKFKRIKHIFISHLHGDHYLGLMGLLSTMHLQGRTTELHLYGQEDLMDIIEMQLRFSNTVLNYNLIFHPTRYYIANNIYEDEDIVVRTIILNHRIPCTGFLFKEKQKPRKLRINKIQHYNIPFKFYKDIKNGQDYSLPNGDVIKNDELTLPPRKPRSYAYCSDTIYDESIVENIKNVDLLYHEATFLHELAERAKATYHTTSLQAAQIAEKAGAKKLLIGHFSARYKDLSPLLEEAKTVFSNTELALEGKTFEVPSEVTEQAAAAAQDL